MGFRTDSAVRLHEARRVAISVLSLSLPLHGGGWEMGMVPCPRPCPAVALFRESDPQGAKTSPLWLLVFHSASWVALPAGPPCT